MISREQALDMVSLHLGDSERARHSIYVGHMMSWLAGQLGQDADLWEVTGICHDLDFYITEDNRSRHGMVTAEWLDDKLPTAALTAIQSHDHRAGVTANTPLAIGLKLVDAIAVAEMTVGRRRLLVALRSPNVGKALEAMLRDRPYLSLLITDLAQDIGVQLDELAMASGDAPEQ